MATLDLDMRRIYGRGDFEHVGYKLIDEPDHRILAVQAVEKAWGPTYVRFGLSLSSDFRGDNAFNLLASIRRTWVNRLGGEWRADVQLGNDGLLFTEFYQPLVPNQYFFIAPRAQVSQRPGRHLRRPGRRRPGGALHRHRLHPRAWTWAASSPSTASCASAWWPARAMPNCRSATRCWRSTASSATSARCARGCTSTSSTAPASRAAATTSTPRSSRRHRQLGASDTYNRWNANFVGARSFGAHTFQFALAGGGSVGANPLPLYDYLSYGGFMRMTGYRDGQLRNDSMGYGRLTYMNQLFKMPLLEGVYVGASLEAARLGRSADPDRHPGQRGLGQPVRGGGHAAGSGLPGLWPHATTATATSTSTWASAERWPGALSRSPAWASQVRRWADGPRPAASHDPRSDPDAARRCRSRLLAQRRGSERAEQDQGDAEQGALHRWRRRCLVARSVEAVGG